MHTGHTLLSDTKVFSSWFPREADNAVFSYQQIKLTDGAGFTVKVYHKNTEETGDGTDTTASFSEIGSTGIFTAPVTGLKELIRFSYEVTGDWSTGKKYVVYRMLAPTWYNTIKA